MPDSKRFDFSKAKLQAIKPPAKGRISVRDARHPALECRITSTGHRAYYWYRKIQGKPVRVKIADVNQMTATRARQIATQHDAQAVECHNPMDDRRAAREAMTLDSVRLHYIESKILSNDVGQRPVTISKDPASMTVDELDEAMDAANPRRNLRGDYIGAGNDMSAEEADRLMIEAAKNAPDRPVRASGRERPTPGVTVSFGKTD